MQDQGDDFCLVAFMSQSFKPSEQNNQLIKAVWRQLHIISSIGGILWKSIPVVGTTNGSPQPKMGQEARVQFHVN